MTHNINHYMTHIYVKYVKYEKTYYQNLGAAAPKLAVAGTFCKTFSPSFFRYCDYKIRYKYHHKFRLKILTRGHFR